MIVKFNAFFLLLSKLSSIFFQLYSRTFGTEGTHDEVAFESFGTLLSKSPEHPIIERISQPTNCSHTFRKKVGVWEWASWGKSCTVRCAAGVEFNFLFV